MASTIQIKNSTTGGNSPSSLAQGEFAINVIDGNLFYGDGSNVKQDFAFGDITGSNAVLSGTLTLPGIADVSASIASVVGESGADWNTNLLNIPAGLVSGSSQVVLQNANKTGFTGASSITTLGTIGTGVWQGTAIADAYISSATTWNNKLDSSGTITTNDYAKFDASGDLVGRSYAEVKTDLSLNNVENTALSTYTGNGGALDNQYITNGAGYTTNTGTVTSVGGTGTVSGLSLSGTVTTSGNLTLGGTISISSTNITDVDAFSQTGTYASLRAQGTTAGDVGLGNVENTALSTWAGSSNLTTLGTVTSGNINAILPTGTVSGSSQIDLGSATGTATNASTASYVAGSNVDGAVTLSNLATTAINATNAANVDISNVTGDVEYGLVFRDGNGDGNQGLYADSEADQPSYNPSTNTIKTPIISASSALYVGGNTTIQGTLSLPGFADVSASLAAATGGGGGGTVTEVTVGTGLDVTNGTTTPNITLDLTEITLSSGLDSTATGLSLDLTEVGFGAGASNRLITNDGDGTVTAEANLTFDGTTLNVDGKVDVDYSTTSGAIVDISNNTSAIMSADHYSLKVAGGQAIGTPGGQTKGYGGYFTAGNTNGTNPDTIALYAQGHEDGAPNSYAAIFSGSAGGVVGINTMEPTVELEVSGDVKVSGNLELGAVTDVEDRISSYRTQIVSNGFYSQNTLRYLTFNTTGETTGFNYLSLMPAPADGRVISISVWNQSGGGSTVMGFHKNSNATPSATDTQTLTLGVPVTFTFSSGNTFSQNDELSFSIDPTGTPNGLFFSIILEYDY